HQAAQCARRSGSYMLPLPASLSRRARAETETRVLSRSNTPAGFATGDRWRRLSGGSGSRSVWFADLQARHGFSRSWERLFHSHRVLCDTRESSSCDRLETLSRAFLPGKGGRSLLWIDSECMIPAVR